MRYAGFEHQALVEWWAPAARVLRHNADLQPELWKPSHVIERDIRLVADELGDRGAVHLIAGGPPCQPFSLAGVHAGHSDERNMFPAALDVVRQLRPQFVVFENVPGLSRPSFAPYLDYVKDQLRRPDVAPTTDELWHDHHRRLRKSRGDDDYAVYQDEVDAADLGVAQTRRRIFLIAIRRDISGADTYRHMDRSHSRDTLLQQQWVTGEYWKRHGVAQPRSAPPRLRTHVERITRVGADPACLPWRTLRDVLLELPEPGRYRAPEGWPNHVAIPGARAYPKHTGSAIDMPSKTIKAGVHGVAGGEGMLRHANGRVRYLTIREAALVQGFPIDYEFPGVRSRVMGVIGNAVAVNVAEAVGRSLRSHCRL
jgi:DNA (cytosine-5)-methyltransferase 1